MSYRLELEPVPVALTQVPDWLTQVDQDEHLGAEMIFRLSLCIEEWLANLLTYADLPSGGERLVLEIITEQQAVILTIRDPGRPFNPTEVEFAKQAKTLEEAEIGGQGLRLIHGFCDAWDYEGTSALGNLLTLRFKREPQQSSSLSV